MKTHQQETASTAILVIPDVKVQTLPPDEPTPDTAVAPPNTQQFRCALCDVGYRHAGKLRHDRIIYWLPFEYRTDSMHASSPTHIRSHQFACMHTCTQTLYTHPLRTCIHHTCLTTFAYPASPLPFTRLSRGTPAISETPR